VVPQLGGLLVARQPADHRAEEGDPRGRLEVQDRRADVLPGQGECLVGFGLHLGVPAGVVERIRQRTRQPELGQHRLHELPGAAGLPDSGGVSALRR
jgi:hypothetical protein